VANNAIGVEPFIAQPSEPQGLWTLARPRHPIFVVRDLEELVWMRTSDPSHEVQLGSSVGRSLYTLYKRARDVLSVILVSRR
jgi:hypothetical protein